ncbi:hypothetical protein ACFWMR_07095 [Amycolatopsis thailandensis]|uniref:Uncharacterized protein n=1 Tax=Amycolatopsis thailandensis TaxID=589330 RepID=A0A229S9V6_9PSEU|nr:hypothetical protein [Amycolatopsis thailandensis]OXM55688.1 hypothetical protein CFP71_17005 [Amycolatopsis thailandensis]
MPGGRTAKTAARLFAVLAAFTIVALVQSALCSDGAAAAGSPCAPLFATEKTHAAADECEPAAPQASPAGDHAARLVPGEPPHNHLDDAAGIGLALAALFLLVRRRRPDTAGLSHGLPLSSLSRRLATTPPLVQLCVSRT